MSFGFDRTSTFCESRVSCVLLFMTNKVSVAPQMFLGFDRTSTLCESRVSWVLLFMTNNVSVAPQMFLGLDIDFVRKSCELGASVRGQERFRRTPDVPRFCKRVDSLVDLREA